MNVWRPYWEEDYHVVNLWSVSMKMGVTNAYVLEELN